MVDQMGAQPGDHVLEIGCGWGGFAEYAAKERGLKVTGLTISRRTVSTMPWSALKRRVCRTWWTFKLQDYRDEKGVYDGIASIEMFEAVGEKYWPVYFDTLRERLQPGKSATLADHHRAGSPVASFTQRGVDFIQKYIFPGGMLPSRQPCCEQRGRAGGADRSRSIEFGESYSQTLRRWHDTFNEKWDQVADLGFDERFRRMWNFYLTSCAATFHSGNCDVTQITVTRPS